MVSGVSKSWGKCQDERGEGIGKFRENGGLEID
jgi:hypothetical protein